MTIVFPRDMPPGIGEVDFEPMTYVAASPERGGRFVTVEVGQTFWRASFRTVPLWGPRVGVWRAFLASLKSGGRTFLCGDPERPYPLAHLDGFAGMTRAGGSDPFDGTCAWSLNAARDVLTLATLPEGLTISEGDYAGFSWSSGARRFLVRALESAVADEAGELSVQVEPFVPPFVPAFGGEGAAVCTLAQPMIIMRLAGSGSAPMRGRGAGAVSFEAVQEVRA